MGNSEDKELDDIIAMLDNLTVNDVSRIKVFMSNEVEEGQFTREYHHGRCDINSPWARGCSFDVLETTED